MKKVKSIIKIQVPAGKATPAPPIGPTLGQHGINIQAFCQKFNEKTRNQMGEILPVVIKVYEDRSFDFEIKTPAVSSLLKKLAGIEKGSGKPKSKIVGKIKRSQLIEIAKKKLKDLNTDDLKKAVKIVEGTAKSMGIEIVED